MKKNIIAVGGQGFLKECIYYLSLKNDVIFKGIVGVDNFKPDITECDKYFISDLSEYEIQDNDYFIICVGDVKLRKKFFEILKSKGAKFYTLLHNTQLSSSVKLGEGNIFIECAFTVDIKIGSGNLFNTHVSVGHDVEIGDFNFFGPSAQLLGHTKVGSLNSFGTLSSTLVNAQVGDGNIIAPGSCIFKRCKNNSYMFGNPARNVGSTV